MICARAYINSRFTYLLTYLQLVTAVLDDTLEYEIDSVRNLLTWTTWYDQCKISQPRGLVIG